MTKSQTQILAERFEEKAAAGLTDVKFYLSNEAETTTEEVCGEINRLYEAVERGEARELIFNDSYLK